MCYVIKNQDEKFLSELLRKEISEVKECFNKYSYQSLVICAAIIVFVFNGLQEQPLIALSVIPAIILLMRVIRIGLHKYATANRNSGYELYLSRIENLYFQKHISENNYIILKTQKWEELLRAWRIVQSMIFESIYYTEDNIENIKDKFNLKSKLFSYKEPVIEFISEYKKKSTIDKYKVESYPWFDLEEIAHDINDGSSNYHCGSYLKEMFSVLFLMQYIMLFIMLIILVLKWCIIGSILTLKLNIVIGIIHINQIEVVNYLYLFLICFIGYYIFSKEKIYSRRRILLENQILSIHSCSIVWNIVAIIHLKTLSEKNDYSHYTEALMENTKKLITDKDVYRIHGWMKENLEKDLPIFGAKSI